MLVFQSIKSHAVLLFGLLAVMWMLEVVDLGLPFFELDHFGIRPRRVNGLIGIPLSPFLHVGFGHLVSNSVPFLVLGGLVMFGGRKMFLAVSTWVVVVGGLGVWLLGGVGSVHLGASGLIFGYLGFLLSRGVFERSGVWLIVSVVILILYGGMIYGVLPGEPRVSWLGHSCGFLAGIAGAWLIFPRGGRLFDRSASSPPADYGSSGKL